MAYGNYLKGVDFSGDKTVFKLLLVVTFYSKISAWKIHLVISIEMG